MIILDNGSKYGNTDSTILWAVSLQFTLYVCLVGRGELYPLISMNYAWLLERDVLVLEWVNGLMLVKLGIWTNA